VSSRKPRTQGAFIWPRRAVLATALLALIALGAFVQLYDAPPRFLRADPAEFVALFAAPPPPNSRETRQELDDLLATQLRRTPAQVAAARADRRTEPWQFAEALGLTRERMRGLRATANLADEVEDDIRPYVRAAKHEFLRLRPYEVDPRLDPCIDDVRGDLSYPSGHATYGYVIAYLLADMVPERRQPLMERARAFARQRMLCGVHFPSDVEAGRVGAEWLAKRILRNPDYRASAVVAMRELRDEIGLPPTPAR
jgi:acid phosphatase (class A)